jgi:hypothetical protein
MDLLAQRRAELVGRTYTFGLHGHPPLLHLRLGLGRPQSLPPLRCMRPMPGRLCEDVYVVDWTLVVHASPIQHASYTITAGAWLLSQYPDLAAETDQNLLRMAEWRVADAKRSEEAYRLHWAEVVRAAEEDLVALRAAIDPGT